jgi:IS1 family transposase
MLERSSILTGMKQLTKEQRCAVIRCLVDGCSIAASRRISGVSKNTIQKLTRDLGEACLEFQDKVLRKLTCKRVECDEIWNFCYCKDKNVPDEMQGEPGIGSMWTWTAMCAETKLLFAWQLGARDAANAYRFMASVSDRLTHRVQLTTDGNRVYLDAVENYFGANVDYAQLIKLYGTAEAKAELRYSPGKCLGARKQTVTGEPDWKYISTAYAERQNLNIRMQNRRYTRLTNAFSKKADMLAYSIAIMFMYHNFVRIHQTLRSTPAMKAGITDHKWSIEEMVDLLPVLSYNTRPEKSQD